MISNMAIEDPITPDNIKRQLLKSIAVPSGLGRKERRTIEKAQRRTGQNRFEDIISNVSEVHILQPIDELIGQDDLSLYKQELREYELLQTSAHLSLEVYQLQRTVGIPDQSIRAYYASVAENDVAKGANTNLWLQANPVRLRTVGRAITNLQERQKALFKKVGYKLIADEDERQLMKDLIYHEEIPVENILKEIARSREESIDLMRMQIAWLENQQKEQEPQILEQVNEDVPVTEPEVRVEERAYSLSEWNLFWTTTHWSQDPNYLISIPTTSREEALAKFSDIARGEISVKPASLLRALEFHLQKDVIQKALATRNKYGREGIRDWVKIKRGRDRMFILVYEAERKAVFFAAGRDDVYRDI